MQISITRSPVVSVEHRAVELVERKGKGHPDTLCDRAAEELSIALSRWYRAHGGVIQHHNTDKVLLVGGRAQAAFGHGEVLDPMYLLLSGRATSVVAGMPVPVGELAVSHTASWLGEALPALPMPGGMIIDYRVKPSSPDLVALFCVAGVPLANDTSFAVAFAPTSTLERMVKAVEERLNSREVQSRYPQFGQDIKVMGLRTEQRFSITIAMAFIAAHTPDLDAYQQGKALAAAFAHETVGRITEQAVTIHVNTADQPTEGLIFLTATGTSAEQGDDGQVGRGNRATGLITPMRPMTLEAAAGKNPVSHVGKIYQVYAQLIVDHLCAEVPEVRAATCALLSRIGAPINEPQAIAVQVETELSEVTLRDPVTRIVHGVLDDWQAIRDGFLERRWRLF